TPCSISNQEAKLVLADDTLPYWDVGKVGRCGLCFYSFIPLYFLSLILHSLFFALVLLRYVICFCKFVFGFISCSGMLVFGFACLYFMFVPLAVSYWMFGFFECFIARIILIYFCFYVL
ncbi:hypothetical protein, partial [uncultured Campylobacter sp.]|uniref:hypothetical protein n=1 Tax=uncultured Campylobacter sp. TaxID=218934 RepID=UPI0026188C0D